ncbi:unnamed protein product [Alopecurus aequalis]
MGAAARPVRTKRPSRRAAEAEAEAAAGGQIRSTTGAASTKRPGRSADAAYEIQVPAVVGISSASRICGAKRRRRTAQIPPPPPSVRARKETSGSHPLRLDPCSNHRGGKRAGSKQKQQQQVLPDATRSRSTDLPRPPDNNNRYAPSEPFSIDDDDCDSDLICRSRRRDCANDLLDDGDDMDRADCSMVCRPRKRNRANLLDDGPAGLIAKRVLASDVDIPPCPPDNNNTWREWNNNLLLLDEDLPASDVDHPPCPLDNNNWRDWANLADGPAGLIAECVLAYDVADYVRFRAVCHPWRQSSTEPRTHSGLDRRFHPWRWTMLREELATPDRRCFLNTSTGECVKVDIPELRDYELLALTPEGLLVLARKPPCTTTICLFNPLTRNLMQLPPLSTLVPSEYHDEMLPERNALSLKSYYNAWGSGIANDDSTVVLCFNRLKMLGMAKPGDDHWTLVEYNGGFMTAAPIMFEGRFYCVTHNGLMRLETGPPRFEVAAKLNMRKQFMADSFHLVNNFGELMLVHSRLRRVNMPSRFYDTYRVDLDTGTVIPVKSLGGAGRALFLGQLCSLSVSLEVFPSGSISADTIYLSFDMYERMLLDVEAYHLADGSVKPPGSFVPRPHTLADCLSLANTIGEET